MGNFNFLCWKYRWPLWGRREAGHPRSKKRQKGGAGGLEKPHKLQRDRQQDVAIVLGGAAAASATAATVSEPVATPALSEYTPSKPHVVPIAYDEGVTPVFEPKTVKPHEPKFQLPSPRPDCNSFEAVVMALTRVYLPDGYIL